MQLEEHQVLYENVKTFSFDGEGCSSFIIDYKTSLSIEK